MYFDKTDGHPIDYGAIFSNFMKLQARGPDNSSFYMQDDIMFGFHRLAINDLSHAGNQPMFSSDGNIMVCNGEIYNFKELNKKYDLECASFSDCETVIQLYSVLSKKHHDMENVMDELSSILEGEYAFILFDKKRNKIVACRDRYGVRPLFIGYHEDVQKIGFASELKAIDDLFDDVHQFLPSTYMVLDVSSFEWFVKYYNVIQERISDFKTDLNVILPTIRDLLVQSVKKRMLTSERPICALLSGGLDSSLICGIISKYCLKPPAKLHTFSIGICKESTDLQYARKVATFIQSEHHEVVVSIEEMLSQIRNVIQIIETYDITTIRASIPHFLLAKHIKTNYDFKVVFSGEMSDEQFGGYLYFKNAPSPTDFSTESNKLIEELCFFDNLRADRCISCNGLEARVPFSDHNLVKYVQSIDPQLKMCGFNNDDRIEKSILRQAFEQDDIIPVDVLYRQKEAFSDGVSQNENSWYLIIQNHIDSIIGDDEFLNEALKFEHCTPDTKESYYYRKIFNSFYKHDEVIPHFWKPKWVDQSDPSARALKAIYVNN